MDTTTNRRLILVTGSTGHLGEALVRSLRAAGRAVRGVDRLPSPFTDVVGSIVDRGVVERCMAGVSAVLHTATLHKPHVVTHSRQDFIDTNLSGTLNLLEAAADASVRAFIFTSTTSAFGDALSPPADAPAAWIDEDVVPVAKNIYGVTKLAAEDLCRLFHQLHRLPMIVLRTSRFFPEEDDMAHAIKQSGENTKANEFLFRRLSVEDAAEAHVVALGKAPELGFDTFIISSMTPFCPADCRELLADAPGAVARYFPDYRAKYEKLGWTMFDSIDRVYDASKARRVLGFACKTGFRELLDGL